MTGILLGEWGFLDNLDDTSGNNITATVNYTPVYVNGPQPGTKGIQFTADGQTITYGRSGLEPLSVAGGICTMAWVKLTASSTGFLGVVHKHRDPNAFSTRAGCDLLGNKFRPFSRWRDQLVFADGIGPDLNDSQWHHLCVVDSDDRYEWYLDGVSLQSGARSGTGSVIWEPYPWFSGFTQDMHSSAALSISGIRIFSGSLSDSDVVQWMNTPIVVPPTSNSGPIIGGEKKTISSKNVIIGGIKKPVSGSFVIVGGEKKPSDL